MSDPIGAAALVAPARSFRGRIRLARLAIRARGRLHAGPGVHIARGVSISVAPGASVVLGEDCVLGERARIQALTGEVRLGARTLVGDRCVIASGAGVTVGEDCVLGAFACVGAIDLSVEQADRPRAVAIGDRARVGAHGVVLAGAHLRAGAVVGSYAVVGPAEPRNGQTVAPRSSA